VTLEQAGKHADQSSSRPGLFDQFWWKLHTNTTLLALILIIFLCVVGAVLYRPLFQPIDESPEFPSNTASASLQFVESTQTKETYYFVWPEHGDGGDIYMITLAATPTLPVNVTNTPNYAELWPIPSPTDDRLAFFAVSTSGERSLRVMDTNGVIVDATYNTANTNLGSRYRISLELPPQWSQDGKWIAFLGQTTDDEHLTTQLFAVDVTCPEVYQLTYGTSVIVAAQWVTPSRLLYAERLDDYSVQLYEIIVSSTPTTPTPAGLLETEP